MSIYEHQAWEAYGQSFKFEDLGQVEAGGSGGDGNNMTPWMRLQEHEWYLEGFGPSTKPEPALLSAISERLACSLGCGGLHTCCTLLSFFRLSLMSFDYAYYLFLPILGIYLSLDPHHL